MEEEEEEKNRQRKVPRVGCKTPCPTMTVLAAGEGPPQGSKAAHAVPPGDGAEKLNELPGAGATLRRTASAFLGKGSCRGRGSRPRATLPSRMASPLAAMSPHSRWGRRLGRRSPRRLGDIAGGLANGNRTRRPTQQHHRRLPMRTAPRFPTDPCWGHALTTPWHSHRPHQWRHAQKHVALGGDPTNPSETHKAAASSTRVPVPLRRPPSTRRTTPPSKAASPAHRKALDAPLAVSKRIATPSHRTRAPCKQMQSCKYRLPRSMP